jgi:hypothetical protein
MSAGKSGAVMDETDERAGLVATAILIAVALIVGFMMRRDAR